MAPLGSEALDLSDLAHLAVVVLLLVLAELALVAQLLPLALAALRCALVLLPQAPGGRGGGVGARLVASAAAPAQPPVVLSLNGKDFPVTGATNVRAGTEYKVTTERPSLSLSVSELDAGSWVMFELPGFTTAASGTAQDSLDALRKATTTSYYKGNGSLWVKLVSSGDILGSGPDSALVAEPASRPAGKQQPCCTSKSPRRRPGAFQGAGSRTRSIPGTGPPSTMDGVLWFWTAVIGHPVAFQAFHNLRNFRRQTQSPNSAISAALRCNNAPALPGTEKPFFCVREAVPRVHTQDALIRRN